MPIEPAGVQRRRNTGRQQELADRRRCSRGAALDQPFGHVGGISGARESIVERPSVAVEDDALAAGRPELNPRTQFARPVATRQLGAVDPGQLERHDLAESTPLVACERDVATDLQLQVVQRGLQLEALPVDRRRERQNRLLELPSQPPELG